MPTRSDAEDAGGTAEVLEDLSNCSAIAPLVVVNKE